MRRVLSLLAFALGGLGRRRGRALSVGLALALVTAANASAVFLTDALRDEARRETATLPDLTVLRMRAGRPGTVTGADARALAGIEGVAAVRPRVWGYVFTEGPGNITVVGADPAHVGRELGRIVHGRTPRPDERGWMVLGEGLSRLLAMIPGDQLSLRTFRGTILDLTVTGIFRGPTALRTADVALVDARDARDLLGLDEDESTDLALALTNEAESPVVTIKVVNALRNVRVVERRLLARAYDLTYGRRGGLVALALLPALLALLVLAWDRATGLGAEERREVGVLKCVGWSTGDVLLAKLLEALVVALCATVAGAVLAYGYVFGLGAPGMREALFGWSTLYPRFALVPAVTAGQLLALAALVAVPYLAAAVIPSWRAATLDPSDAMRE